jgi:TonB family protein
MSELNTLVPKTDRRPPSFWRPPVAEEPQQRRMMIAALTLLLIALGLVLYHDRNFWFPDTQDAQEVEDKQPASPAAASPSETQATVQRTPRKKSAALKTPSSPSIEEDVNDSSAPIGATATRTVLPPLEVEVVAGNVHRTLHPGTNSVEVTMQPESLPEKDPASAAVHNSTDTTAAVTNNAAEHVQMSVDTAEVVSQPVKPGYPLLARQMKVQGSVILQALIGRDGLIQDLQVVSGPPILATAAQEAVKQWHFKPHYQGAAPVETQAKITVNFTISTN